MMNWEKTMLIRDCIVTAVAGCAFVGTVSAQPVWPPPYAMIRIKAPSETGTTPYGINGVGAMAGSLGSPNLAFVWQDGVGHSLHSINPLYAARANDINDAGWVVGRGGDFDGHVIPTLWINGMPMSLGTLGGDGGEAHAVNYPGHVVGRAAAENQPVPGRAFRWYEGKMIDLGTLGAGAAFAWGVNNLGQVVGHSALERGGHSRAFLWENDVMIDIGTPPGGVAAQAFDINDLGQIVGFSRDRDSVETAFLRENGEMRSIHDFSLGSDSWALRINNLSQVVGLVIQGVAAHAFIWDDASGMRLIEDLIPPNHGLKIRIARDINDHGQIALEAERGNVFGAGKFVGALVTPVHPTLNMADPSPGRAGEANTLTITNATPGATVRFFYSLRGGGEIIPGCATRVNALQLADPQLIGTAIADQNGVATITRVVPPIARGQIILFQSVVQNECAISQLIMHQFE